MVFVEFVSSRHCYKISFFLFKIIFCLPLCPVYICFECWYTCYMSPKYSDLNLMYNKSYVKIIIDHTGVKTFFSLVCHISPLPHHSFWILSPLYLKISETQTVSIKIMLVLKVSKHVLIFVDFYNILIEVYKLFMNV